MGIYDQPTDPYGDERHCHICDAVMIKDSMGEWSCLQYHEDDLVSQEDYTKKSACPVCGSNRVDIYEADESNIPYSVEVLRKCHVCKAYWNEIYKFDRYEMVGTK